MPTINDVWQAYERAHGRWSGCDWQTGYGSLGLDLAGVSSTQAHEAVDRWRLLAANEVPDKGVTSAEEVSLVDMALHLRLSHAVIHLDDGDLCLKVCENRARRCCAGALAAEWEFAACWLEEVEADARWAEMEGLEAVLAAEDGDWELALSHARRACSIKSGYDDPRPWGQLKHAIERAAR
jgi:hypothetical protein